jgi:hypothetical protein
MLWYKGWLETRLRLLFCLAFVGFILYMLHLSPHSARSISQMLQNTVPTFFMAFCALLGGAGIATQPPLQATKGLHGSMLFTLSLPVSRFRLIAVRASIGLLELASVISILLSTMWFTSPALRTITTPSGMFEFTATVIVCASSIYSLSVLLATFLDDQWRVWGTLLATIGLWWLSRHFSLPASIDIFFAMSKGSPLFTHTMPWAAMAFAVALSAVFFVVALKIVQSRQY